MQGQLDNISQRIVQTNLEKADAKADQVAEIKQTIISAIADLKEEVMVFTQGLKKDKNVEKPDDKSEKRDIKSELKEQQIKQQGQIEKSDESFQQRAEFLTKGGQKIMASEDEMGQFAAAILQDDNIKKTDKKNKTKTKLEEKLEMLASLEGDFKNIDFGPEDKEVVEEFFDRLNRMKNLKTRLKQLENMEKKYGEELEKQKKEEASKKTESPIKKEAK
jgi:hypothetical protein